ncbi:M15 family metallopeptidase, partial [Bacillus sp. CLL-7-23]
MAVSLQTLIDRSVRNMGSGIHPVVKETAIEVIKRSYKEGIYVQMTSGYRSFAEQNKLYAKGRTASGKIVTNAKAGQSNHNYGLAVDYVLLSSDGKTAIWTVNSKWKR